MSTRKRILSFSISVLIAFAMGCGGGRSTVNVRNPTAPPASTPISIAFKSAPGGSLIANATAPLTAVVTNDQSNAGVDWVLTCSNSGNCGSISPLHTQSAGSTTYTAPASVSGTGQAIIVEAFATADHTKNVAGTLNIMGFTGSIKGNYVFETQGVDANGAAFQLAGVVALDGNGNVTGGEQTHGDIVQTFSDTITGGSYTLGPDGRGTLTINTADQNIGQAGIENFATVFLSNARLFLVTLDNPNLLQPSNETSSGIMDLQTSTAAPTGGYAFVVNGSDISLNPLAMGGVMNIGSSNTIEKTGSVIDQDDGGTLIKKASVSGTSTNPDSFGSLKFTLTSKPISPNPLVFTGYIVDSTHIKLIESDNTTGTGFGATSGIAVSQGTATGTFTNSSFSGNFVFGILGQDLSFAYVSTSLSCAGTLTANGSGKLTSGLIDEYLAGFGTAISDSFTGTYKVDTTKTGRANASINFTTNGPGPELIFYLTGNGNPPLVLDADSNIGSVGTGAAYSQASAPIPFNGPYGLYFTQNEFALENDASAEIAVNGSAQTLSGTVDTNFQLSALPNTAITGTFNAIPSTGRVPGTLTNTFFQAGGSTPNTVSTAYYLIDSGHAFVVETDSATTGILLFGYLSQRTPLCQGCP